MLYIVFYSRACEGSRVMRITLGRKTYFQQKVGQEKNKRLRPISNCKDDLRKGGRGSEWERTSPDPGHLVLGLHVWEGTGEGSLTEPRELVRTF